MKPHKADIYQIITDRFVAQLEKGTVPWRKPWVTSQNLISGKSYQGINVFLLANENRESPFWLTYKQAADLGGSIMKGEKSTPVIYWSLQEKKDARGQVVLDGEGKPETIPFIRWSNVFSLEQTDGIKAPVLDKCSVEKPPMEVAQGILDRANICPLQLNGQVDAAYYHPVLDFIEVPAKAKFLTEAEYYHTAFHELAHATGHKDRLNRDGVTMPVAPKTERYAKEELIAELSAAFLSNEAGILGEVTFQNSASYMKGWIKVLKENPKILVGAGAASQKASNYILSERERVSDVERISTMIAAIDENQHREEAEYERE